MSAPSSHSSRTLRRAAADAATPGRPDRVAAAVAFTAIVVAVGARLVAVGVLPIAPDDAEYIGVGRRLWALHAPNGIDGTLFTIRSWVWPVLVGGASHIGGDPFTGPRVLGVLLGLGALVGAVEIGRRLGRGPGALAVAGALLVTPVLWEITLSTRVDVALLAGLTATLLLASDPSPRRAVLAGLVAGLTMLVKETSAPMVLLPFAWLGALPRPDWWRRTRSYVGAFVAVVAWWFVVVLATRGELFPFQGVAQAESRSVPRTWSLDTAGVALVAGWVVAWIVLALWRRRDVGVRVALAGFVAMLPATAVAWRQELAVRQFAPVALIGAIVLGLAVAETVRRLLAAVPRSWRTVAGVAVASVALAVLVLPVVHVQVRAEAIDESPLDATVARWIDARDAGRTASTFRYKAQVWARVGDHVDLRGIGFEDPTEFGAGSQYVWIDWRGGQFHALPRVKLTRALDGADALVLSGRHRLGPIALARWLHGHGGSVGFEPTDATGRLDALDWARLYRLRTPDVGRIPTLVTSNALSRMTDAQVGALGPIVVAGSPYGVVREADRIERLTGTRPPTMQSPL